MLCVKTSSSDLYNKTDRQITSSIAFRPREINSSLELEQHANAEIKMTC